ncbi:DMT family transporter [Candidatus Leptofilum sp.]|uniref:DMT family transporter n=1 Tax=Candidatus Leptofilum sp. TaxID=3241576 RepID=UPI003B5CE0FA
MKLKPSLWIILLSLLWAPAFLLMKIAVHEIPPFTLAAVRVLLAALLLTAVLWQQKLRFPRWKETWWRFAGMGLFLNALPYLLVSWGEQYVDSGLASLLIGTDPLFTMLIAHFFIADDRLTPQKALGAAVGFAGLGLLAVPQIIGGISAMFGGILAVTAAALSYGIGGVFAKKHQPQTKPMVTAAAQLWWATLFLLPLSLIWERPFTLTVPSLGVMLAVVALVVVCTALTYVVFMWLISFTKVTQLAMIAYLVPIFGLILGIVVLGERPDWTAYAGGALILLGVMVVNGRFAQRQTPSQPELTLPEPTPGD